MTSATHLLLYSIWSRRTRHMFPTICIAGIKEVAVALVTFLSPSREVALPGSGSGEATARVRGTYGREESCPGNNPVQPSI